MVLPLSSRILKAEAKAKNSGFALASKSKKHVSGYSADRSDQESPPASLCTTEKTKEKRAQHVEQCAKRRRTKEANFQAFNARNDLIQAGVKCQPGLFGRSRAVLQGCVDMDTVDLIVVSKETSYPNDKDDFQETDNSPDGGSCDVSSDDYMELLICAQQFYLAKGPIPTPSEDAVNERSSQISSSNTTGFSTAVDSENEFEMEIPPIAQDRECYDETLPDIADTDITRFIKSSLDLAVLTLNEAIIHFSSARLIVEQKVHMRIVNSNAAFSRLTGISIHFSSARLIVEQKVHMRIVNSNAAFSRLTGISSEDLIGKSLIDLLDDSFITKGKTNTTLIKLRNVVGEGGEVFSLITFPVKNNKSFVTHFALEFSTEPHISSLGNPSTTDAATISSTPSAEPFNAVG
eukprot:CAMPEP_0176499348 /NCGR_PEP_ID=MMETSP0200_2-20121128/12878_1 /TAXON_ID=947934 /ORGANISM="Chaetoceros sp., Strain GSL56" /LENGTH=404 /DNA_ID=CAMNT_0017897759 /DNA_START=23 /DNA_END=1237 /DNA_ORIENTATION=-